MIIFPHTLESWIYVGPGININMRVNLEKFHIRILINFYIKPHGAGKTAKQIKKIAVTSNIDILNQYTSVMMWKNKKQISRLVSKKIAFCSEITFGAWGLFDDATPLSLWHKKAEYSDFHLRYDMHSYHLWFMRYQA